MCEEEIDSYIRKLRFREFEIVDLKTNDLLRISKFIEIIIDKYSTICDINKYINITINSYLKIYEKYQNSVMEHCITEILNNLSKFQFRFNEYFINKFEENNDNVILVLFISNKLALEYIVIIRQFDSKFIDKVLCRHYDKIKCSTPLFFRCNFPNLITKILNDEKQMVYRDIFLDVIFEHDKIDSFKKFIEISNYELNVNILERACDNRSIDIIKYVLLHKVIPNSKCFTNIFSSTCGKKTIIIQQLVNLLIEHGYVPSFKDIKLATEHRVEIDKFDDLDVQDNGELLKICVQNKFMPKYYSKLKSNKIELDSSITLAEFKKFVKKGFKPTINDLRTACEHCKSKIVEYIIDLGVKPDLECLKNSIYGNDRSNAEIIFSELACFLEIKPNRKMDIELLEIPKDFNKRKLIKLNKKLFDTGIFKKQKLTFTQIKDTIITELEKLDNKNSNNKDFIDLDNELMYKLINPDKEKIEIPKVMINELIYTIIKIE
jgi:hypothetical protein